MKKIQAYIEMILVVVTIHINMTLHTRIFQSSKQKYKKLTILPLE
jgi:hypothetical protein